jgi:hypothetical protein
LRRVNSIASNYSLSQPEAKYKKGANLGERIAAVSKTKGRISETKSGVEIFEGLMMRRMFLRLVSDTAAIQFYLRFFETDFGG